MDHKMSTGGMLSRAFCDSCRRGEHKCRDKQCLCSNLGRHAGRFLNLPVDIHKDIRELRDITIVVESRGGGTASPPEEGRPVEKADSGVPEVSEQTRIRLEDW